MGNAPLPWLPTALIQIGARYGRAEGRVQERRKRQRHLDDINTEIVTMERADLTKEGLKPNPMGGGKEETNGWRRGA